MTPAKLRTARRMREGDPPESYAAIAAALGLSTTTVHRHLAGGDPAKEGAR
jgi:AcrR family transcriptional regulator